MKPIPFYLTFLLLLNLFACRFSNEDSKKVPSAITKIGIPSIDSLTERIFKEPKNAGLYYERAKLFYQEPSKGGYDYAILDMKYALGIDSLNVDYHHFLAEVYMKYAQSRLALQTMERAAALYPDRVPTLLKLAEYQLLVKQNGESLETLNHALKMDPQSSEAYFLLGQNFKQTGDSARAINSFQKAADLNSDNTDAFIELGLLFDRRNSPLALRYFDNALSHDSLNVQALFSKAVYWQNHGQEGDAVEIYQKINTIDPHYPDAYFNLGVLFASVDSVGRALDYFNSCIREKPTYFKAYYYRGLIEEKKGDTKAALEDYRQASGLMPGYEKARDAIQRLSH